MLEIIYLQRLDGRTSGGLQCFTLLQSSCSDAYVYLFYSHQIRQHLVHNTLQMISMIQGAVVCHSCRQMLECLSAHVYNQQISGQDHAAVMSTRRAFFVNRPQQWSHGSTISLSIFHISSDAIEPVMLHDEHDIEHDADVSKP